MGEDAVRIADAEGAEHEDRRANAGLAEGDALLDVRAREHRDAFVFERPCDASRPVSVGIGLDDADDAGGTGGGHAGIGVAAGADKRCDRPVVRADGVEIDVRDGDPHCTPCARLSNRVYWLRNDSFTEPIGPLRCLPMMISAIP
jgi:hypothetical protein